MALKDRWRAGSVANLIDCFIAASRQTSQGVFDATFHHMCTAPMRWAKADCKRYARLLEAGLDRNQLTMNTSARFSRKDLGRESIVTAFIGPP